MDETKESPRSINDNNVLNLFLISITFEAFCPLSRPIAIVQFDVNDSPRTRSKFRWIFHPGVWAIILLAFVFAIVLISFFAINIQPAFDWKKSKHPKTVSSYCLTEECLQTAKDLMQNMDKSIDPCDDFYKFVCGQWSNNLPK